MTTKYPNPKLDAFQTFAVYPFCLRLEDGGGGVPQDYRDWCQYPTPTPAGTGWVAQIPLEDSQSKGRIAPEPTSEDQMNWLVDQWFLHEVRSLFCTTPEGTEKPRKARGATRQLPRVLPKFRWLKYVSPGKETQSSLPALASVQLGLLDKARNKTRLHVFDQSLTVEITALLSLAGIVLYMVHIKKGKRDLYLADAMRLNSALAYPENRRRLKPVLIRRGRPLSEALRTATTSPESSLKTVTLDAGIETLGLSVMPLYEWGDPDRGDTAIPEGPGESPISLIQLLRGRVETMTRLSPTYTPIKGRLPVVSQFLVPMAARPGEEALPPPGDEVWEKLQWLASRCVTFPKPSQNVGGEYERSTKDQQGPEFRTMYPLLSQRFHVSSEGLTAWGWTGTEVEQEWPTRVRNEYLVTYLLALHQSLMCLDLSWRSYTRTDTSPEREDLIQQHLEYSTEYDFTVISNHFNVQRLYRLARETLGVEMLSDEVAKELSAWIDDRSRKEQESLNSVALLAVLFSLCSIFVGINIQAFNNDSAVELLSPSGLWFWIPTGLVTLFVGLAAWRGKMVGHFRRLWRLMWREPTGEERRLQRFRKRRAARRKSPRQ